MAYSCGSSYASSLETTNYARICRIVVDVLRDILWQVLTHEILPADLPKKVQTDKNKLGKLDLKIKSWLCGISPPSTEIPSAEKFDVTSLYTLIRNLCSQVPTPSRQWGQIPPAGGVTLGDDIERVREFRNTLYGHATQAKIETPDFNKLCIEIRNAVRRFDAYFCSLSRAMKCDFQCEIDTILRCFMDKSLEDDYIEKMKEIAILSDDLGDIKQQVGVLMKKVDRVQDKVNDVQKDVKKNAEDSRNRLCRIQETLDTEKGKFEKDTVENTTCNLVNEERDCNENAGISHEDIALEMPQGKDGKICIIKCYADLKLELERDIVMDIAKDLFKKKKHKDVFEEVAQAETRRLCVDRLLKRVLKLKERGLKSFFDLLKIKCPERAQKVAEIKVTDKDRRNFTQVSKSVKMVPHRIQNGLKFEQLDVEFFQCHFQDIPEKVDKIADVLLSQFHISICNHSQMMQCSDPVKKIHALLEKIRSCHFDSDSEVQSVLGSSLYDEWQSFRVDGSRQEKDTVEDTKYSLVNEEQDCNENAGISHKDIALGLENQGVWHYLLERIQSCREYLIEHFRGLRIYFQQARRGSLVLKFVTLDNFDVKLLKPEAVKTKVWDMIKTLCPEYQDIFKEPVHLTIFFKPLSNTDSAEIHFYLETRKEKEEFSCMKLGSRDKQYIVEEMGPVSLTNWMFKTHQFDEDKKTKLVDLVSRKDLSRRKKMKNLLNIVESLGKNGYELLEKYCEEHDTFLYDKVFKKHRQLMVEENPVGAQQYEFSYEKEGMQTLSSTWINFTVDPKGNFKEEDMAHTIEEADPGFPDPDYPPIRYIPHKTGSVRSVRSVHDSVLDRAYPSSKTSYDSVLDRAYLLYRAGETGRQTAADTFHKTVQTERSVPVPVRFPDSSLPPILPDNKPTERQLGRISMKIGFKSVVLGQELGLSQADIHQIQKVHPHTATQCLMICFKWMLQSRDKATFRNLEKALKHAGIDADILGSVNKAVDIVSCLPPHMLDMQPEDKHLNQISSRIETKHVHLGVELEVPLSTIEQILTENLVDVHRQCFEIMKEWRQRKVWWATFRNLEKAFICVGINPDILKQSLK